MQIIKKTSVLFIFLLMLASCGKPSAKDIASKFCGMLEQYHNANTDDEKKKISEEMEAYERKMKKSYKDEAFQREIKDQINICADELEAKYGDIER